MSDLVLIGATIPAMTEQVIDKVADLEQFTMTLPQIDMKTTHTIHAGIYTRTILIPEGAYITGALVKVPTTIIISGHCLVYVGADDPLEFKGYYVLPASANRKQAFMAVGDTVLTMMFQTEARTVEEAEREFTDEIDLLLSANNANNVLIGD